MNAPNLHGTHSRFIRSSYWFCIFDLLAELLNLKVVGLFLNDVKQSFLLTHCGVNFSGRTEKEFPV